MRIETGFDISRHPADTYALLLDLERVMPCFPGAELLARRPDGARDLRVTVRLGPMRLSYQGDVRIAERDDAARRAVLAGNARETRGGGSANARIAMRVEWSPKRTWTSPAAPRRWGVGSSRTSRPGWWARWRPASKRVSPATSRRETARPRRSRAVA